MIDEFFAERNIALDPLTEVYTRETIVEYVNYLISEQIPFSLAISDIDNFKYVNDNYGHIAGDEILKIVSAKLVEISKDFGVVGRFGGDEFMVIMPNLVEYDKIWANCRDLLFGVNEIKIPEYSDLFISATLGLARFPENEKTWEGLLETADKALYRGKMKGRNCFIIYLPEKHANIVLKTEKDTKLSSMYLHSSIFKQLTENKSFAKGINNVMNFLSSYFMIDHLCIQYQDKMLFEKIHLLSDVKSFEPINTNLIKSNMNQLMEIFYFNTIEQLKESNQQELVQELKQQGISSAFYSAISYQDELYGYLRADLTHQRVWQHLDMDLFIMASKIIAMYLHDHSTTLDEMVRE